MQKEVPTLSTISPVQSLVKCIIATYLNSRRAAVKDDDAAKYLRLGPVSGHIGKAIRILVKLHIGTMVKHGRRKILAEVYRFMRAVSPLFVESMFMHSLVELEQVNCDLVARHGQKFNEA